MGSEKTIVDDQDHNPDDELSTGLSILSFCIPLAGAIIYFSNKSDKPEKARKACHMALWGIGVGIVLNIISYLIQMASY
jgi:FtsH-binding integral membrane protein